MPRNNYTYAARDALNGQKLVCGTIHADNLEDAARRAIHCCELTIQRRPYSVFSPVDFFRNGRKVYLSVGVPAEYYLDATTVETITPPPSPDDDDDDDDE